MAALLQNQWQHSTDLPGTPSLHTCWKYDAASIHTLIRTSFMHQAAYMLPSNLHMTYHLSFMLFRPGAFHCLNPSVIADITVPASQCTQALLAYGQKFASPPLVILPMYSTCAFLHLFPNQGGTFTGIDKGPPAAPCCLWAVELCCCLGV